MVRSTGRVLHDGHAGRALCRLLHAGPGSLADGRPDPPGGHRRRRCAVAQRGNAHHARSPRCRGRSYSSARQRFPAGDADQFAAESGRTQSVGERRAQPPIRASVQRRCLPGVQTGTRDIPVRVRATGGSPFGLHDGRGTRVGHHRRAVRRIQRCADHPARQCDLARPRLAAAHDRRDRSARIRGQPQNSAPPTSTG